MSARPGQHVCSGKPAPPQSMLGAIARASASPRKEKATMNQKSARDDPQVLNPGEAAWPRGGRADREAPWFRDLQPLPCFPFYQVLAGWLRGGQLKNALRLRILCKLMHNNPLLCSFFAVASFVSHNVEEKTKSQILIPLLWEIVTLTNTPACRGQR